MEIWWNLMYVYEKPSKLYARYYGKCICGHLCYVSYIYGYANFSYSC